MSSNDQSNKLVIWQQQPPDHRRACIDAHESAIKTYPISSYPPPSAWRGGDCFNNPMLSTYYQAFMSIKRQKKEDQELIMPTHLLSLGGLIEYTLDLRKWGDAGGPVNYPSLERAESVLSHLKPGDGYRKNTLIALKTINEFATKEGVRFEDAVLILGDHLECKRIYSSRREREDRQEESRARQQQLALQSLQQEEERRKAAEAAEAAEAEAERAFIASTRSPFG